MTKHIMHLTGITAALVISVATLGSAAHAQEASGTLPAPSALPAATATAATPVAGTTQVFVPAASSSAATATTASASVPLSPAPVGTTGGIMTTPETPHVVTDAVNGLQKTDPINLDDMIKAQDAISRLDLLLEIEKRQNEIKKVRDERNKPSALGAAIPASALNLPSMSSSSIKPMRPRSDDDSDEGFTAPSSGGLDKYAIKRITGTNGRYAAVLNSGSTSQNVRAGDKLSDGTLVKTITLTSVTLVKGKKSRSLTIPSDSYIVRE